MVDFNIEQLMKMLIGMAGKGSSGYQSVRYGGIPAHFTQAYGYQPGWMEKISRPFFPHRQRIAPPTVLQRDWETMVRVSQQRSMMAAQSTSDISPVAQRSMEMFFEFTQGQGKGRAAFKAFRQDNPFISQYLMGPISSMMFGPGVNAQKQAAYMDVSRHFAGRQFNVPGTNTSKMGLPGDAAGEITRRLYGITYKDDLGFYKRFAHFGVQDMSDIMRMGLDYGMELPVHKTGMQAGKVDLNSLTNKVKGLARVVDAGMAIFKTMDKEKVIENIMELTQGRIPIGDTSKLENMIYKLNAMARRTSLTVKYMQKISTEGARLFEQIGVAGDVGAGVASVLPSMITTATQGIYGTKKFTPRQYTPQEVADLGGQQTMRQRRMVMTTSYAGSKNLETYGFLYTNANEQGKLALVESLRRGETPNRAEAQKLLSEYGKYYARDGVTNPLNTARIRMENETFRGKSDILRQVMDRYGPEEIHAISLIAQTKDIERKIFGTNELGKARKTFDIARLRTDKIYQQDTRAAVQGYFEREYNKEDARSYALQWSRAITTDPKLRRESFMRGKADVIISQVMQENRKRTSLTDKITASLAFDGTPKSFIRALTSVLPGMERETFNFKDTVSPNNLNKADLRKRIRTMGDEKFLNMTIAYGMSKNTFLGLRRTAAERITGYNIWDLAGLDISMGKDIYRLSDKVNEYRDLSDARMKEQVIQGFAFSIDEGLGNINLGGLKDYATNRGFNHRIFLDYTNKELHARGINKQITLKKFSENSAMQETYKRSFAYLHAKEVEGTQKSLKIANTALQQDMHFGGNFLSSDLHKTMKTVMNPAKLKQFRRKVNDILNMKKGESRDEALTKLVDAYTVEFNNERTKQYKDTKKNREESFRIGTTIIEESRGKLSQNMLDSYRDGRNLRDADTKDLMKEAGVESTEEMVSLFSQWSAALQKGDLPSIQAVTKATFDRDVGQLKRGDLPMKRANIIAKLMRQYIRKGEASFESMERADKDKFQKNLKIAKSALELLGETAEITDKDKITDSKVEIHVKTIVGKLEELINAIKESITKDKGAENQYNAAMKAAKAYWGTATQ